MSEYEIEVKYRVLCDVKYVKEKLSILDLKLVDECIETDTYLNHPCKDFSKTDEALRLRIRKCSSGTKYYITYKGPREPGLEVKKRIEIESIIVDYDKVLKILERLGFTPILKYSKHRTIYGGEELSITIDQLYDVGVFLEIETCNIELIKKLKDILGYCIEEVHETYLEICLSTKKCRVIDDTSMVHD
ncbi:MAG: adenylyl cyclase [Desulfurococcales archaeon ex4484_58]|nr:MAG: adenylyl cyclase [Desulfurococcales archaeon ex4484_58]